MTKFNKYVHLLLRLQTLEESGMDETELGEEVREQMEFIWYELNTKEQKRARKVSKWLMD